MDHDARRHDRATGPCKPVFIRRRRGIGSRYAMNLARTIALHLRKDLRLEWRSKDASNSMLFFALLVVVVFAFAFDPLAEESRVIAGGIAWIALLFATVVALNQSWARELHNSVLDALRLAPAPPNALFLAKASANFVFVA